MQAVTNTSHLSWHWQFVTTSVLIPFCFVLIMNGIEGLVDTLKMQEWTQRGMKIAWDNCVLALGLAGGILSNPEVIKSLGGAWALIIAIVSIIMALSTAVLIGYWRKENTPRGWKVWASIALSGGVLAVLAILALAYEGLSRFAAFFN